MAAGIDTLWAYKPFFTDAASAGFSVDSTTLLHQVEPQTLFGSASLRIHEVAVSLPVQSVVSDTNYMHIVVALMFVAYCLTIITYPGQTLSIIKMALREGYCDKMLDERSHTFSTALHTFNTLGIVVLSSLIVRFADQSDIFEGLDPRLLYWAMPGVALIFMAIIVYQWLLLYITGTLLGERGFINSLWYLKSALFSLFTVTLAPLSFLYLLNYAPTAYVFYYITLVVCSILIMLWLYKSYRLFVGQNLSILHWFLYLCAVELLPLSFLYLLSIR